MKREAMGDDVDIENVSKRGGREEGAGPSGGWRGDFRLPIDFRCKPATHNTVCEGIYEYVA